MTIPLDLDRHIAYTPGGQYAYQLMYDDENEVEYLNLFGVWRCRHGNRWVMEMSVFEEDGAPKIVAHPHRSHLDGAATDEAYMRAAGHIWMAHKIGLWIEGDCRVHSVASNVG